MGTQVIMPQLGESVVEGKISRWLKQVGDQVALLGSLTGDEMAHRWAASQVLAVPSSYEGFGIIYLEGMQFGLPAIAGTAGAAKELITHGHNGFLVPPGNPEALAHYIELLIRDRDLLLKMSLAAHDRAAAHPTWNDSAARVRGFLQSFMGLRPTH